MYLGVRTCVLRHALHADPGELDFGQVTAKQRKLLPITLSNLSSDELQELHVGPLPENACFTVRNAPRPIGGKPFRVWVEFKPERVQIYQTRLELYTQNTRVDVPLKGKGVRPVLKIDPEDGIVRLPPVIYTKECKDYTTQKVEVKNDSPYELVYRLESVGPADANHNGISPFTLTPSTGIVEAHGSKTVTVTFRPHRPRAVFREKVLVDVPNQKEPTYLYLYGHCFLYQVFAMPYMDFRPFGAAEAKGSGAFVDALCVGQGSGGSTDGELTYQKAQQLDISVKFEHDDRLKYVLIGACVQPGTPSAPQNPAAQAFELTILPSDFAQLFTVEAPEGAKADKTVKGVLKPGETAIKVAFRYNPPEEPTPKVAGMSLDLLGGIGQWIACKVKCVLSGGFIPPNEAATQEVSIELNAYLQQI